jgi:hypothetical protein
MPLKTEEPETKRRLNQQYPRKAAIRRSIREDVLPGSWCVLTNASCA